MLCFRGRTFLGTGGNTRVGLSQQGDTGSLLANLVYLGAVEGDLYDSEAGEGCEPEEELIEAL